MDVGYTARDWTSARRSAVLRACALIAIAALSSAGTTAATSRDAWPSAAATRDPSCPQALVLEPAGGRKYRFAVGAKAYSTAFLEVTLFTAKGAYEVRLPGFRIDRPSEADAGTFRSAGALVESPVDEPVLGASIADIGTACGAAHALISSPVATSVESAEEASMLAGVRRDALPAIRAIRATPVAGAKPQTCAQPFQPARGSHLAKPVYPESSREEGAIGTAAIRLELDAAGRILSSERYVSAGNAALDGAALSAARTSTYSPAIFACRPDAGSFILPVTFNGQN